MGLWFTESRPHRSVSVKWFVNHYHPNFHIIFLLFSTFDSLIFDDRNLGCLGELVPFVFLHDQEFLKSI